MASYICFDSVNCCSSPPAGVFTRGSIFTTSGWVMLFPSIVSFTVYVPGITDGDDGDGGVL